MKTTGNTILITGGGTGIGRGLAEAFHQLGNQVIISGRTKESLDATTAENPGMKSLTVDLADPVSSRSFAARLAEDYPSLNVLINNAGMMHLENLLSPAADSAEAEAHIVTNLLGPIRLTAALLPLLQKQSRATVMLVSSVLGFVPWAAAPTYCATKAAIHAYAQSLRYQLKETPVQVLELILPYVATTLLGERPGKRPARHAAKLIYHGGDGHPQDPTGRDRGLCRTGARFAQRGSRRQLRLRAGLPRFEHGMGGGLAVDMRSV